LGQPLSQGRDGGPEYLWRLSGTASLAAQTLARLAAICPTNRTVIVLNDNQREHVGELPGGPESGRMVFQPHDRGTAVGLLFGLLPVLTTDPAAVVLVTHRNQAVENTDAFQRGISDAVTYARRRFALVLVGAESTSARSHNEVMIVAQARALLHVCRKRLPVASPVFVAALSMPPETQKRFLAAQYPQLPSRDLVQHVLMAPRNLAAYTWPRSVGSVDLKTLEQLQRWLQGVSPRGPGPKVLANASPTASTAATPPRPSSEPAFTLK